MLMTWRIALGLALSLSLCAPVVEAAKKKAPAATMESRVSKPGSYVWQPERSASGAVLVVVSLPEQRAHIYRGGKRIGLTTVSTGSEGRDTPPGHFEILQKRVVHHSNLYDDAPMPFMQRLTWDGIALHAGHVPGYPASHGCIRLPRKLAEQLFAITDIGTRVIVADENEYAEVTYPGDAAPVDALTGAYIFPDAPPPPPPAEPPSQRVTVMGDGRIVRVASGEAASSPISDPAPRPVKPTDSGYRPYSGAVMDPAKRVPTSGTP